jgi:MerR family redox-sensitive transcriptional activator SoxR
MSKPSVLLSIGEVAQQTGLRPSALRYHESAGLLPAPVRESGQRRYEISILKHIRLIQAAQKAGFSIKEIKLLLDSSDAGNAYAERLQALAQRKLAQVEQLIADAQAMKQVLEAGLACHCARMEDCLMFVKENGEEQAL